MADIAERADITKGTIYLYFKNKEELFNALVREHITDKLAIKIASIDNEADVLTALQSYFDIVADMVLTDEALALGGIITVEARNNPALAQFWRAEVVDRLLADLTQLILRGTQQGVIGGIEPEIAAQICLAPALQVLVWQTTFGHGEERTTNPEYVLRQQRTFIMRGLHSGAESLRDAALPA